MGGGNSQLEITNQANIMTSDILTQIQLSCGSDTRINQAISVNCYPKWAYDNNSAYENNPACKQCIQGIADSQASLYANIRNNFKQGRMKEIRPTYDDQMSSVINQFINCGKTTCKACVISDINQSSMVNGEISCAATNNIRNTLSQQLQDQITQQLSSQQDVLSSFAQVFGANSEQSVVNNLTSRMMVSIKDSDITSIYNNINSSQNIRIDGNSSTQSITQTSSFNSAMNYLGENNIFNNILSENELTQFDDIYSKTSTISELGDSLVSISDTLSRLSQSIIGIVMICVLGLVFLIIAVVVGYSIFLGIKSAQRFNTKRKLAYQKMGLQMKK